MKKIMYVALVTIVLILANSQHGNANGGWHHGHGGHFGVGIVVGPGWGPGWWGPPYYPYYPSYSAPPAVATQEPQTYVQQEKPGYWYYCANPEGYYPYVKQCPKGWMTVVPSPPPGEGTE